MDHTDTGLRAVVKALTDVIAPAVNPANPLAGEQLRLAVDYVEFARNRIDFLYDREQFELRHHLGMARGLEDIIRRSGKTDTVALGSAIEHGERVAGEAGASTRKLKAATAAVAAAISAFIRETATLDEGVRRKIERCVLDATDERIAFERSWYLPLGFDPAPGEVKKLQDLCGA